MTWAFSRLSPAVEAACLDSDSMSRNYKCYYWDMKRVEMDVPLFRFELARKTIMIRRLCGEEFTWGAHGLAVANFCGQQVSSGFITVRSLLRDSLVDLEAGKLRYFKLLRIDTVRRNDPIPTIHIQYDYHPFSLQTPVFPSSLCPESACGCPRKWSVY